MAFIKNLCCKKTVTNLSLILGMLSVFGITFILLGLIHKSWCFIHDDFGVIWHCQIHSWQDLINFFSENSIQTFVQPSNYRIPAHDFFSVYYRPVSHIIYSIENLFFTFSPYPYFLVRIFFHSLNVSLLYYFFYLIIPRRVPALLATLAFSLHPTLATAPCIGVVSAQDHTINLTFLLLSLFFLKKHLDLKKAYFLFLSLFFFTCALFCIETAIFFPIIVGLGVFFHTQKKFISIKIGLLFVLVSVGYLILRLTIYPSSNIHTGVYSFLHHINPLSGIQNRFFDCINLCCSLAYIPWLTEGHSTIKIPILVLFIFWLFLLFILSKNKSFLLFLFFAFILMLWPAYFRNYSDRYLYPALPFFLAFCIITLNQIASKINPTIKKVFIVSVGLMVLSGGYIVINMTYAI